MYKIAKRVLDFVIALTLLIIFAIPMVIVAILIKAEDKGPVFYKQLRMGKDLKPFYIYKFRTMITNRKELESTLPYEELITKCGKFLRATSIDELPQLFNILNGEMSFIGPRPWMIEYYEWFTDEQKKRTLALPGMSGLAQVMGRNGIGIFEKIQYDLEYIEKRSLFFDIKIFFLSIVKTLQKDNSNISETGIKEEINLLKSQQLLPIPVINEGGRKYEL